MVRFQKSLTNALLFRTKSLKAQKKAKREKTRARQEEHMKEGIKNIEARGRQEAWHTMLMAHMELLCSLNMTKEVSLLNAYGVQE